MAQALEKIFLQKVAQMPQEEVELLPPAPKGKGRKPAAGAQNAGKKKAGREGAQAFPAEAEWRACWDSFDPSKFLLLPDRTGIMSLVGGGSLAVSERWPAWARGYFCSCCPMSVCPPTFYTYFY